jgi:holo-[acyl-carrier protein] synthase
MTTTGSQPLLGRSHAGAGGPRGGRCAADGPSRTGVDVVDVRRFARLLDLRGALLTDRVFTPTELAACGGDPARLAARFAAKEAVAKALGAGIGPVAWRDVEVRAGPDGAPRLVLTGGAARLARHRGLRRWSVSLAHDGGAAVGVVVGWGGRAVRR